MRLIRFMLLLILSIAVASPGATIHAQSSDTRTISNSAGYQLQVPGDWLDLPASNPSSVSAAPADKSALVNVFALSDPALASLGATGIATLGMSAAVRAAQSPDLNRSGFQVGSPAAAQVPGADAALSDSATYKNSDGATMDEYLLVAVRGATAYALSIDIAADRDAADPAVAQGTINSFQLTGGS